MSGFVLSWYRVFALDVIGRHVGVSGIPSPIGIQFSVLTEMDLPSLKVCCHESKNCSLKKHLKLGVFWLHFFNNLQKNTWCT